MSNNCIIGEDFKVVKRNDIEKFSDVSKTSLNENSQFFTKYIFLISQNVLKFTNDRLVPSSQVNSEFLTESIGDNYDVILSENNLKTTKKVNYQNTLKSLFYDGQKANTGGSMSRELSTKEVNEAKNNQKNKFAVQFDWACRLINIREKFVPDFETLQKKSFDGIRK